MCRARRALTGGTAGQRERLRRPLLAICGKHGPGKGRCLGYSDMPKVSVVEAIKEEGGEDAFDSPREIEAVLA